MYKTVCFAKKLITPLLFTILGVVCFLLPLFPGTFSNYVAWMETDGLIVSYSMGVGFFILGVCFLIFAVQTRIKTTLVVSRGTLTYLIERGVLTEIVEQILAEYFNDTSLSADLFFKKNQLFISVEVPEEQSENSSFAEFLTNKLFAFSGYYGKINLTMIPKHG